MGVIKPWHQLSGKDPEFRTRLNSLLYIGIRELWPALIISFLILSEKAALLFFSFVIVSCISVSLMGSFKVVRSFSDCSITFKSLTIFSCLLLFFVAEWRAWKWWSHLSSDIGGIFLSVISSFIDLKISQNCSEFDEIGISRSCWILLSWKAFFLETKSCLYSFRAL